LPPWRKKLKELRKTRVEGTEGVALATVDVEDVNKAVAGAEDTV
jgi:hypothetical protein